MNLQVRRRRTRIELVPMIDVLFFMVVFFMMFSTLNGSQTSVPVNLPKTLHMGNTEQNTLMITIDRNSRLYLGKQMVRLNELQRQVGRQIRKDSAIRVIVRPDAVVDYQEIVKVMDTLASVGVQQPLLGVDHRNMPDATKFNLK
jgi:biopolymer transport protein ExbD